MICGFRVYIHGVEVVIDPVNCDMMLCPIRAGKALDCVKARLGSEFGNSRYCMYVCVYYHLMVNFCVIFIRLSQFEIFFWLLGKTLVTI